ncbi:MAG: NAD(P)-dependent oxidoreductase [Firmicutes bacterium]|jgi:3-hydroxyisobutyrate dehydrogenase-like beta-hydroxyacid dehydrogenase|nr:NAD(P)-dependent oxidoreductase [Bacillota bacterium]
MTLNVGFIGVGNIGMVMAKSILKAGIPLAAYDINEQAVAEIEAAGARAMKSCREVMEASDAVITMVRDTAQTEKVVFGENGLWEGAKEGSIIILASTIGPDYPRELHRKGKEKGIRVLDMGVTKNIYTNEIGQFTLMVSGDDDVIDKCWPVFTAMGRIVFRAGKIGYAQAYKLINNMMAFNLGSVLHECLNVGLKAGLDMKMMLDIMHEGTGASWMANSMRNLIASGRRRRLPKMDDTRKPARFINKDQVLALELAEKVGAKVPLAKLIEQLDEAETYDSFISFMSGE